MVVATNNFPQTTSNFPRLSLIQVRRKDLTFLKLEFLKTFLHICFSIWRFHHRGLLTDICLKIFQNTQGKVIIARNRRKIGLFELFTCGLFANCEDSTRSSVCSWKSFPHCIFYNLLFWRCLSGTRCFPSSL